MTDPRWRLVQDHWPALRSRVALYWPRLRPDAVRQLTGDRASLVRLVKEAYALTFAEAEAQIDTWLYGVERELGAATSGQGTEEPAPADDQATTLPDGEGRGPRSKG